MHSYSFAFRSSFSLYFSRTRSGSRWVATKRTSWTCAHRRCELWRIGPFRPSVYRKAGTRSADIAVETVDVCLLSRSELEKVFGDLIVQRLDDGRLGSGVGETCHRLDPSAAGKPPTSCTRRSLYGTPPHYLEQNNGYDGKLSIRPRLLPRAVSSRRFV